MKKYVVILLSIVTVFGLCACFTGCSKDENNKMDAVKESETEEKENTNNGVSRDKLTDSIKEMVDADIKKMNWKDFAVCIDDNTVSLPVKCIWLYQLGFSDMELEEHAHGIKKDKTMKATSTYEDCKFSFELANLNKKADSMPIKECYVIGFTIEDVSKLKDCGFDIVLPGGIDLFDCTEEKLKDIYGNPSKEDGKTYKWTQDDGMSLEITMKNKKEIKSVTIKNNVIE